MHEIAALLPPICSVLDAAKWSNQLGSTEVMRDTTLSHASQLTLLRCSVGITITTTDNCFSLITMQLITAQLRITSTSNNSKHLW